MKNKLLLTLLCILLPLMAVAQRITDDEAAGIASQVLGKQVVKAVADKSAKAPARNGYTQSHEPFYSIYTGEDGSGFVIVSTDRRAPQVIGYGDGKADANNLPPQLKAILERQDSVLQNDNTLSEHPSWRRKAPVRTASSTEGKLLKTANWGQSYPYNLLTPEIDGQHCPTGCVATAMAIAMQYNGWPEKYDWSNMPTEENNATNSMTIAKLMVDAGESVYMNYNPWESGAHMNWVGHKLQSEYKFSPECQYITAANFSEEEWISMLRDNLDDDNIVIYSGGTIFESHAFIIDGYQGDTYHVNWGWDGFYNGLFALDMFAPQSTNYSENAGMVINITPDKSGFEYSNCFVDYGYFFALGGMLHGCYVSVDVIKKNEPFDFSCYFFGCPPGFDGAVGVALVDKDNHIKEVLKSTSFTTWSDIENKYVLSGNNMAFYNLLITSDIESTDKLQLVARGKNDTDWKLMLGTIEASSYLNVEEAKAYVSKVHFDIKSNEIKLSCLLPSMDWREISYPNDELTLLTGSKLTFYSDVPDNHEAKVKLTIKGKGLYGDTDETLSQWYAIGLYDEEYFVTCELINPTIEKVVNISTAGTLSTLIQEEEINNIATLKISGQMNAVDFWYIRDNFVGIKSIDISEVNIVGCDADDPKYAEFSPVEQTDNYLPSFALAGLKYLTEIKLPSNIEGLDFAACTESGLTSIDIPASVTVVGLNAFNMCESLETVICRSSQPPFINDCALGGTKCPENGVLFVPVGASETYRNAEVWKDFSQIIESDNPVVSDLRQTIDGVQYRLKGNAVSIYGYVKEELAENLTIPDELTICGKQYPVTEIEESAFDNAPMKTCIITNNINTVGNYAFSGCSDLQSIILPNQLKRIPLGCFYSCQSLEELEIPESVEVIGNSSFDNLRSLKRLYIPKNARREYGSTNFGNRFVSLKAFEVHPENEDMCQVDGVLFTKDMKMLLNYPGAKDGSYRIPDGVTKLSDEAFSECYGLTELTWGESLKLFDIHSIYFCPLLKHLQFTDGVIFENNSAISDLSGLESITLADASYTENAFWYLSDNLNSVFLRNSQHISMDYCFYPLTSVDYYTKSLVPNFSASIYNDIYVPGGCSDAFSQFEESKVHEMWQYRIYRDNNAISISNVIDSLEIQSVVVNGKEIEAKGSIYYYEPSDELDVVINYRLYDRQEMATHYDAAFNANIPSSKIGDINGDGKFTISDITFTASHIMGTLGEGNEFYSEAADIDKDGLVLVNDLTAIIDLVLAADNAANAPARTPQKEGEAALSVFDIADALIVDDGKTIMDISIKPGYIATQFDLLLPEGTSLTTATLAGKNAETHKMTYRCLDGNRVRVVIFSMNNAEMSEELVRLTLQGEGEVVLTNALVNELQTGGKITEKAVSAVRTIVSGNATGISSLNDSMQKADGMYNLNGQKVNADYKGIVIKNGTKIVR